jgi:hypothetical protein
MNHHHGNFPLRVAGLALLAGLPLIASAEVFYFTDEAAYQAKLVELGYATWEEDFSSAAWDPYRTVPDASGFEYHVANSIAANGIAWMAEGTLVNSAFLNITTAMYPGSDLPGTSTVEDRWAITPVTLRTDYDAIGGAADDPLYAVGGWFTGQLGYKYDEDCACSIPDVHITVTLDGVTDDFGAGGDADPYKLINALVTGSPPGGTVPGVIVGPRFFGAIDTSGFTSFSFNSDIGTEVDLSGGHIGYYGPIVYGDDFTFAAASAPVPEPATWAMLLAGLVCVAAGSRRATRKSS